MAFHIRTVIQSGVFSEMEDKAFTDAIGKYAHIPTNSLIDYLRHHPAIKDSFFRGSIDALAHCPYPRAHTATPMHVFNWLHFAKYIPPKIFVNYDWQPIFGRDLPTTSPLFIRSATGDKRLHGDVYTFDNKIEIEIAKSTFDNIRRQHKNDILIIASPKNLQQEQRYVVYKDKVITGSEYITCDGNHPTVYSSISDLSVADSLLKQSSLKQIIPLQDQPYTLDIAFIEGEPKILEINSFWCAGMYGCDIGKIISTLEQDHYFE